MVYYTLPIGEILGLEGCLLGSEEQCLKEPIVSRVNSQNLEIFRE